MAFEIRYLVAGVLFSSFTVACTIASPTLATASGDDQDDTESKDAGTGTSSSAATGSGSSSGSGSTGGGGASSCAMAKVDPSTLTACNGGHCYDKDKIPPEFYKASDGSDAYPACPTAGQVCMPDAILKSGGDKLKSCTSIVGAGACMAANHKDMAAHADVLTQDVCAADEKCAPCDAGQHNPYCDAVGVSASSCTAGSAPAPGADGGASTPTPTPAAATCCTHGSVSSGVCLPESAIPASEKDQVKQDTCSSGNACVPAAFVNGKPVKCSTFLGAGVCLDTCFNDMLSLAGPILQSNSCGATEACIPCSMAPAGTPGCS